MPDVVATPPATQQPPAAPAAQNTPEFPDLDGPAARMAATFKSAMDFAEPEAANAGATAAAAAEPKADPAKTDPKTEPAAEATVTEPQTGKDKDKFKPAKEQIREATSRAEAAERKVAELEAARSSSYTEAVAKETAAIRSQLEALTKERDELDQQLRISSVERHPKFKAFFDGAIEKAITGAKGSLGAEKAGVVEKVLRMPDSEARTAILETLLENASSVQQMRLGAALNEVDRIRGEREAEIARAGENLNRISAEEAGQQKARQEQSAKLFDGLWADASKHLEVLQQREGDAGWNAQLPQDAEMAKAIFMGTLTPEQIAKAAVWSVAAPKYRKAAAALAAEVDRLNAELAKYKGAKPTVKDAGAEAGGGGEPLPFDKRVLKQMGVG